MHQRGHQLGARRAQRVAQRNGTPVDVELGRVGAGVQQPGQRHRGEGFVDFEQVDVVDLHAGLLQRMRGRRQRRFEHDHRVAADHRHVVDARQRLDAQRLEPLLVDHHHAGRAVADLAGVGRRDVAAFTQRLHAGDAFERGLHADALVGRVLVAAAAAVGQTHVDRHHLGLERTFERGRTRALMAQQREAVELFLRQLVLLGDHLRAHELAEVRAGETLADHRAHVVAQAGFLVDLAQAGHRDAAHAFHAGGDDAVHRAGHHRLRREVQRLLRRAALAVDGHAGHLQRQLRGQCGHAADAAALLAGLQHAAHDHVFHQCRVSTAALEQRVDHLRRQIHRMPARDTPPALATRGARGGDDISFSHDAIPLR